MEDLGLDTASTSGWFTQSQTQSYVLVKVNEDYVKLWATELRDAVRRCYIADALVLAKAAEHGVTSSEIIEAKLPHPSATMAGDFGEIVVFIYQATSASPTKLIGPKKWRLKQDRTKPAPYSDVVHFHLPHWPSASADDAIFCAEVKTKTAKSSFDPISDAIEHSAKDRAGRLAKTLAWFRERALTDDLGSVQLAQITRFINATEYPPASKHFQAVAVLCSSLAQAELAAMASVPPGCSLVIVVVPNLKETYTAVFEAARASVPLGSTG